ncbi:GTP-binding protein [Ekhidna lutea]|uniref:Probable GTP-binding protein EngB n=1 Tax=Ekhidna lutea TaxID=447679 RepID=A0A239JL62_EKHLU|nr:ribosome biogenesis GTP-binding protein YihA/YsxC [Ekhidna lutea]SNT06575.1 GTP-binding protein [Ekhidna lutea]
MQIKSAEFVISSPDVSGCPPPDRPEYAFIGRSNVGKSSLINHMTNRKKLAKTSSTPGKTQLINHFLINESWYLVDLPGYGWAQTSKTNKAAWKKMIHSYLEQRQSLACVFVLVDSRHEPQKIDLEFMEWLGTEAIPFSIVFTKADKLGKTQIQSNVALYKKIMKKTWEELPPTFITSSADRVGGEEILEFIERINAEIVG